MADTTSIPRETQQELMTLRQRVADLETTLAAQPLLQTPRASQDYADEIVETVRAPLLILTADLRVQSANPAFYQTFQVHPADTAGRLIYHLGNGRFPHCRRCWRRFYPTIRSSMTMR
jgi:PAS domain-containing protein